jgi:hypothetical protein
MVVTAQLWILPAMACRNASPPATATGLVQLVVVCDAWVVGEASTKMHLARIDTGA